MYILLVADFSAKIYQYYIIAEINLLLACVSAIM